MVKDKRIKKYYENFYINKEKYIKEFNSISITVKNNSYVESKILNN